ncbi:MAG TPA: hypothetical protein VE172_18950 [Stackebrandtia sp.]|jgi:hypothetical protein|uniref:hypothetical protein n=1 Tax=Stackebrandtia sp. TaxID=2023065 RepID=UPI002D75F726|nr:hypothetical protein [Stackebrandtia sp.]HZE40882.1 hypothetical protein [Stackebrandtia sp.]
MAGKKHHRWAIPSAVAAGAVIAATVVMSPWSAQADGNKDADATWKTVYGSDDIGGQYRSIAVGGAKDVWAFGSKDSTEGDKSATRLTHWDGKTWTEKSAPKGSTVDPDIADASGPDNVWAGGEGADGAVMLHYDGKKWGTSQLGSVNPTDVEAIASDDVWLSGDGSGDGTHGTMKHYDGKSWKDVSGASYAVRGMDSVSSKEVYAAGSDGTQPTVDRWNGKKWASMKVPKVDLGNCEEAYFTDVLPRSSKDVWAVGTMACEDEEGPDEQSLLAHWDGSKWTMKLGTHPRGFEAVADDGDGGMWMATQDDTYYHYQDGKLTAFDLGYDQEMQSATVENLPGTTAMVGTGALYEDGDPPDPQSYGIVAAYGL